MECMVMAIHCVHVAGAGKCCRSHHWTWQNCLGRMSGAAVAAAAVCDE